MEDQKQYPKLNNNNDPFIQSNISYSSATGTSSEMDFSPSKKSTALREQEKMTDSVKKENFSLKLRVHYLEECLSNFSSSFESAETAKKFQTVIQENVELKVLVERLRLQIVENETPVPQHEISERERKLSEIASKTIDKLKRQVSEQKSRIRDLEGQVQSQSSLISNATTAFAVSPRLESNISGPSVLEETLISYRNDIERLEEDLAKNKGQVLDLTAVLAQRGVEMEQLKSVNESLRFQLQQTIKSQENLSRRNTANSNMSYRDTSFFAADTSGFGNNSTLLDGSFDSLNNFPSANQQLERGIAMLRDQISDLKLQLIDKTSSSDRLLMELESRNQNHTKTLSQMQDSWNREEMKLKNTITELKDQLSRAKNETQELNAQLETIQHRHHVDETRLQMEVQNYERQLQSKNEKLSEALQNIDKLQARLKTVESTLELKKSHAEQLSRQLESKTSLIQTSEKDHLHMLDQLNTRISNLQDQLTQCSIQLESKENETRLLKEQIDRQKAHISSVEERWIRQTKDVAQQQRDLRQEMEQQIHQFKTKVSTLAQSEQEKESRIKELQTQLEMHSIGMEESIRAHVQEKEKMKVDLQQFYNENENLRREITKWQHRLNELDIAYKESISAQDSLTATIESLDQKLKKTASEVSDRDKTIRHFEQELKEKAAAIKELNIKLLSSEDAILEGQQVVSVVEQRFSAQVAERNNFFIKIQTQLDEFLSNARLTTYKFPVEDPATSFLSYADGITQRIHLIQKLPGVMEDKIRKIDHRFHDEMRVLNQKLERKISQLEQFESIIKEAVTVQKRMRESLKEKQDEIHHDKETISNLQHQVSILQHELATSKSESSIVHTSDRSKLLDSQSKLLEAERLLKEKERNIRDDRNRIQELEDSLTRQKQTAAHRINELTDHLRMLRQELEISQKQYSQLENMLKQRSMMNDSALSKKASMMSLLETSEAAYEKMNKQLVEEVESLRKILDKEKTRNVTHEQEIFSLRNELQRVRRKLEKREAVIEMALSKLELVNHRKGSLEMTILNQFSDDMRRMMESTDSVMATKNRQSDRSDGFVRVEPSAPPSNHMVAEKQDSSSSKNF